MTANELTAEICRMFPNTSVCCQTDEWLHAHGIREPYSSTQLTAYIIPGLSGEECTIFRGQSWFDICEQFKTRASQDIVDAVARLDAAAAEQSADVASGDMHRAGTCIGGSSMPLG